MPSCLCRRPGTPGHVRVQTASQMGRGRRQEVLRPSGEKGPRCQSRRERALGRGGPGHSESPKGRWLAERAHFCPRGLARGTFNA